MYALAISIVVTNTIFLFFASIHCPKVIDVRGKVMILCYESSKDFRQHSIDLNFLVEQIVKVDCSKWNTPQK